ncbi:hypothetical protein GP486_001082 [Trichoglossum hirsutum]|uniref:RING-type domain-containing protein n=1 Tax=Trichoglossum hirsutum TaxID=265104 RepID=A0A9P8RSY2_9PEZI|nr:hypothetical protein GP486_001082 [Trichoglossum hirsutum]
MAPEPEERDPSDGSEAGESINDGDESHGDEDDDEEEDDDEPRLKYVRLTGHLGGVYRNGDATSTFTVAGDRMIIGTHNGNIHVFSLPSFQLLRVYHAHSASVTAISVSPKPPPLSSKPDAVVRAVQQAQNPPGRLPPTTSPSSKGARQHPVPSTPNNSIHIATSSIDGNVCVASLVDPKDVLLRNFARPVQAVALSPEFRSDRTYLSGGLAGNLILTVGGRSGTSATSTTVSGTAASASSWLGAIGIGSNTGKDTILHSGEGAISTIRWSLSGKYIVWINEQGIKIMRSHMHLDNVDSELAWKRISHVDRPDGPGWEEMSGLWKGRAEWVDEADLEIDEGEKVIDGKEVQTKPTSSAGSSERAAKPSRKGVEKLLVGWGGMVWVIDIHPSDSDSGGKAGGRSAGRAEIVNLLRTDCTISGLSLYTPSLLLILAYLTTDDHGEQRESHPQLTLPEASSTISAAESTPKRGKHRQNALTPELRLIDLATSEELSADSLSMSRFESLSANDYHLAVLPAARSTTSPVHGGALEGIGSGLWAAGLNATGIFSSNASFRSGESKTEEGNGKAPATPSISSLERERIAAGRSVEAHHLALKSSGMKIFIHSPYDCVLSAKRDLSDHLSWLLSRERYKESWELIYEHPEIVTSSEKETVSLPGTPVRRNASKEEISADDASTTTDRPEKAIHSAAEKEKRRIGELWIQQTIASGDWETAGKICGKVLGTSSRWEHWVWIFAQANKFEEITPFIPTTQLRPPLPSLIYEVVLGHYISHDRLKLKELLDGWPPELFDIRSVTRALESKLESGDVGEDATQGGERGRDWHILTEGLAKLNLAGGRPREALKYFIRLKDADATMNLIRDYHLLDAISDDIPGFILLRVTKDQMNIAPIIELEAASAEPIKLLVDEAHHGIVRPLVVVAQLQECGYLLFLFFYLKALWKGEGMEDHYAMEGKTLVEDFGDLAVELFAEYDRDLLMDFLKTSQSYTFEKASAACEQRGYIPELVYLLSKTGQTKRALFLIIDKLENVSEAIAFAKSQDDPDLWNDLLDYSMDKPRFIRGLLEEVGTAIDPITLVRRIPEGLEIEGLREGLSRMIKEYEIQFSISDGVARVLRSEVAMGMDTLRSGQRKGIKFNVADDKAADTISQPSAKGEMANGDATASTTLPESTPPPGHCADCMKPFFEDENETLVGFVCGHIFHLSCLLTWGEDNSGNTQPEPSPEADSGAYSRSVRTKVLNARIIKDKIPNGCPVCMHRKAEL